MRRSIRTSVVFSLMLLASLWLATVGTSAEPTPLAKLASEMQPGAWAELTTEGLNDSVLLSPKPGTGMDLMGWSDDSHWDSKSGQLFFMGLRQTRQMMAYRESENAWRAIAVPDDHLAHSSPPKVSKFGHIYSRNALDAERGQFYHMDHNDGGGIYRFDIATEKWTKLPSNGKYSMTGVIEYFAAKKWLLFLGDSTATKVQVLQVFDTENGTWSDLGKIPVHGYHSLGRHNPLREEVLLAGGNETPRAVVRVTKAGKVEALKDFPHERGLSINSDKITVDPRSGKYLIMQGRAKRLYEFDSATQEYRLLDDFTKTAWPFGRYDHPIVAFIPEHGVTMWAANSGVWLYRHTQ